MGYDALGNITSKTDASSGAYVYGQSHCGVTAGPHAVTNVPGKGDYCYDLNGNMTSGDSRSVQYTAFNKPARIQKGSEVTQLHYGPSRQRYKRIDTGTQNRTTYYMGEYEKEVRADKTIHRIQLGDFAIVEKVDSNPEQIQYTIRDDLGSLIATVSDTGQIKRLNFDPWGKRLDLPVAESQPIDLLSLQNFVTDRGFTGHEHLDGSGLIHMNGRVYDPVIARFISADPLIQAPSYLQSHNRYSYVWNNPLRATDPSGFRVVDSEYTNDPKDNNESNSAYQDHKPDGKDNAPAPSPAVPEPVKPKSPVKTDDSHSDTQPGSWLERFQSTLNYIGLVPVIGDFADILNAGIYAANGEFTQAGISGLSALPFLGTYIAGAKMASMVVAKGPVFFRGAKSGDFPSLTPRPNEFKIDKTTGMVKPTHGVSVFDNPNSVSSKGFVPHKIDKSTVPDTLQIIQRGKDPRHFEITPKPGVNLTPQQFIDACSKIGCSN